MKNSPIEVSCKCGNINSKKTACTCTMSEVKEATEVEYIIMLRNILKRMTKEQLIEQIIEREKARSYYVIKG